MILGLDRLELHIEVGGDVLEVGRKLGCTTGDDQGGETTEKGVLDRVGLGEGSQRRRGEGNFKSPPVCSVSAVALAEWETHRGRQPRGRTGQRVRIGTCG